MTTAEWNRARSDFNHGWLKNRLIVALHKASRILSGAVEDDTGLRSLRSLLAEWPEHSEAVRRLIERYSHGMGTPITTVAGDADDFVRAVAQSRWNATEDPGVKMKEAKSALREMDALVEYTTDLTPESVAALHDNAQRLATALSSLSVFSDPHE
jgi:hypothetical protein